MNTTNSQKGIGVATVVIIIALLTLGGITAFYYSQTPETSNETMSDAETMVGKEEGAMTEDKTMEDDSITDQGESGSGFYEDYSPEKLSRAGNGYVVLFFKAPWCPTCRALDKNINEHIEDIPSDVSILKVDYDTSTDLKMKYKITYQHTFVQVDQNGELVKKWQGSPTLSDLLSEI